MFSDLTAPEDVIRDDGLQDYLNFGKYSGKKIIDVMREDSQYIDWACEEDILVLDEEALDWFEKFKANIRKSNSY